MMQINFKNVSSSKYFGLVSPTMTMMSMVMTVVVMMHAKSVNSAHITSTSTYLQQTSPSLLSSAFTSTSSIAHHNIRTKREAYKLPAGAKEIMKKDIKTTFKCDDDGYYADIDNDCKIFHRCHTDNKAGGQKEKQHYSFICNDKTVFDQSTFTCKHTDDAIPCSASPMFYNLNERIGSDGPFLTDADIERAKAARPAYRA